MGAITIEYDITFASITFMSITSGTIFYFYQKQYFQGPTLNFALEPGPDLEVGPPLGSANIAAVLLFFAKADVLPKSLHGAQ